MNKSMPMGLQRTGKHPGQRGFTLVEILVSLVIGLFLTAGLIQLLLGNRQTYRVLDNLSELQENGRFAMDMLSRHIRMAGFRNDWQTPIPMPLEGVDGTSGAADQFTLRYESTTDCVGGTVAGTPPIAVNTFAIATSDGMLNLRCTGNGGGGTTQPLVVGVEDMQIQYGLDSDGDGAANYYTSTPPTATNVARYVSLRVQLRLISTDVNLAEGGDGRIRRTFSSTVTMRNSAVAGVHCPPQC